MRLLIGILAFLIWSAGSGYWYVCKIKGACSDQAAPSSAIADATAPVPEANGEISAPDTAMSEPLALDSSTLPSVTEVPEAVAEADLAAEPVTEVKETPKTTSTKPATRLPGNVKDTYTIYFSYARPIIADQRDLDGYLADLAAYLDFNPNRKIRVVGYTDDTAARENNLKLGMKRAEVIADMLRGLGVKEKQIILESKGEDDPVGDNNTREGRQKNRRVEVSLKM